MSPDEEKDSLKAGKIEIVDSAPDEFGPFGEIFRNRFVVFRNDPVEFPDGSRGGHVALSPAANSVGGAAILPIWEDKLVLCREFRHAIRGWQVGIPRGFADSGESSEQAARRELVEEYGVDDFSLEFLGSMAPDSSVQSAIIDLFLARLGSLPVSVGEFGASQPILMSVQETMRSLGEGELTDSFMAFAVLKLIAKGTGQSVS